ncbi:hypothetical protein BCR39DRAFT_600284 [Naematelia encephala]|uniref:Uncharacterized protein n=1 Tax=Naematelia encephala TaxID=71784 RepID=A0A1Y2AT06_9TREE|nr:hypothetical protein BCR39DRAFT_600284 [Naematelia encephala]
MGSRDPRSQTTNNSGDVQSSQRTLAFDTFRPPAGVSLAQPSASDIWQPQHSSQVSLRERDKEWHMVAGETTCSPDKVSNLIVANSWSTAYVGPADMFMTSVKSASSPGQISTKASRAKLGPSELPHNALRCLNVIMSTFLQTCVRRLQEPHISTTGEQAFTILATFGTILCGVEATGLSREVSITVAGTCARYMAKNLSENNRQISAAQSSGTAPDPGFIFRSNLVRFFLLGSACSMAAIADAETMFPDDSFLSSTRILTTAAGTVGRWKLASEIQKAIDKVEEVWSATTLQDPDTIDGTAVTEEEFVELIP